MSKDIDDEVKALQELVIAQRTVMIPLLKFYIKHWQRDSLNNPADVLDAVDMLRAMTGEWRVND